MEMGCLRMFHSCQAWAPLLLRHCPRPLPLKAASLEGGSLVALVWALRRPAVQVCVSGLGSVRVSVERCVYHVSVVHCVIEVVSPHQYSIVCMYTHTLMHARTHTRTHTHTHMHTHTHIHTHTHAHTTHTHTHAHTHMHTHTCTHTHAHAYTHTHTHTQADSCQLSHVLPRCRPTCPARPVGNHCRGVLHSNQHVPQLFHPRNQCCFLVVLCLNSQWLISETGFWTWFGSDGTRAGDG